MLLKDKLWRKYNLLSGGIKIWNLADMDCESNYLQTGSRTLCGPVVLLGFPGPASLTATTRNSHSLFSGRFGTVNSFPVTGDELTGIQLPVGRPFVTGAFSITYPVNKHAGARVWNHPSTMNNFINHKSGSNEYKDKQTNITKLTLSSTYINRNIMVNHVSTNWVINWTVRG